MQHYKQLTSEQRYQISGLKKAGLKQSQIAGEVGVDKSTISRELRRNKGQRGWRPKQAQELRDERRRDCTNATRFTQEDWDGVKALIQQDMSPDQAAERLALEGGLRISHETIYQHIYADKRGGGKLWQHLRCQKPRRKRYASGQERRGTIKNRVGIDERPEIVDQKTRIGDLCGRHGHRQEPSWRIGHAGREEVALCSGSPGVQQTCGGRDGGDNATAAPAQTQVPHRNVRQREGVCGA